MYEYALAEDGWEPLLGHLSSEFASGYAVIMSHDHRADRTRVHCATGHVTAAECKAYDDHYSRTSPILSHRRGDAAGTIFSDRDYPDYDGYVRSEIYNDFFTPLDAEHMLDVHLQVSDEESTSLVLRRGRAAGAYGRAEARRLSLITPHLQAILRLRTRIGALKAERDALHAALDQLSVGAVVTDPKGDIAFANDTAREMLTAADAVTVDRRQLVPASRRHARELHRLVGEAAESVETGRPPENQILALPRSDDRPPLTLSFAALPQSDALGMETARVLVLLHDPEASPRRTEDSLIRLYGLTPAEARLSAELAAGRTLAAVAERNGVSIVTVRSQLQSTMAKTGINRQADLIRLVLGSARIPAPRERAPLALGV
ncbi:hypothetical protein [Inquilinus sp. CAU 1745]|uniref:hypothetical protein n=1 Tax=Inquilinus sp. CAU 1745 TaxID=3140369 RepID=UPI00325C2867